MRIVSLLRPVITLALVVASACQTRPTSTPAPQPDPPAASLFILNTTAFDVSVFAVPTTGAKPVWLTNVPVGASRTVALRTTAGSTLRGVTTEAFDAAMR